MKKLVGVLFLLGVFGCSNQPKIDIIELNGFAQGTTYHIVYINSNGDNYQRAIDSLLIEIDNSLSTYNKKSIITKFNQADSILEVDKMFLDVFKRSKEIYAASEGAFDPTVTHLVNAWGFGFQNLNNTDSTTIDSLLKFVDFESIEIFEENKIIKNKKELMLDFNAIAQGYWDEGIRHLVALRGDAPDGEEDYHSHPDSYNNAAELVAGLRQVANFEISVAAYPEMHPSSPSSQADLDNLKRKVDAGANRAITQFFFDADTYLRFLERARAAGIWVPIVPGILPVSNFVQASRFAKACGAIMPAWMAHLFEGLEDDPETRKIVAVTAASEQCRRLQTAGVADFHFYTLNRADLTYAICHILGLRPRGDGLGGMPA